MTTTLPVELDRILPRVQSPVRYVGDQWNAVSKPWDDARVLMARAFPGRCENGASHPGDRVLHALLSARPEFVSERVCRPWPDREAELRAADHPRRSHGSLVTLGRRKEPLAPRDGTLIPPFAGCEPG